MKIVKDLSRAMNSAAGVMLKRPMSTYCFLETTDGAHNLIGKDGSICSIIRVDGLKRVMGVEELVRVASHMTEKMSSWMASPGHAVQIWFARDPDLSGDLVKNLMLPARNVAKRLGIDLEDVFSERERHLPRYIVWEGFYIAVWTRLSVLTKQELERTKAEMTPPKGWPNMADAQNVFKSTRRLIVRHDSVVNAFVQDLGGIEIRAQKLDVHDALKVIRSSVYPDLTDADWRPSLSGDPIVVRRPEASAGDYSHLFWPRVDEQLFVRGAERVNTRIIQIGRYNWAYVNMSIGPQTLRPFAEFLQGMVAHREFPWRISFLIEGDGLKHFSIKASLASIMAFTNTSENKPIKEAIRQLQEMRSQGEVVVRMRVSFATWSLVSEGIEQIEERASRLQRAVEGWGYCGASMNAGDPLSGVFSSALGLDVASTAPGGAPPLSDVMYMLPWNRDSSPWDKGPVLFRTPDGRPWPYMPSSSKQNMSIDLIAAPPGFGKSVNMTAMNLALCLSPQATAGLGGSKLPRIAILDIGPSSSGLISLLKEALPVNRRHEVQYRRLRMVKEHAINVFDTQLGCRRPLQIERSFLVNFISLLGTPVGQKVPPDGFADLAGVVVDMAYERLDDRSRKGRPKPYVRGQDSVIDAAIDKFNLEIDPEETWWGVADKFFEIRSDDSIHYANLAQRFAVPLLEDLNISVREKQIEDMFGKAGVGGSGESLIEYFQRTISSSIREYPILTMPTRFDIGDSRVVALDLDEAAPKGGGPADKQTAMVYMLGRYILARDFYLNEEALGSFPEEYRPYQRSRIKRLRETQKRIVFDEFHRTKSSQIVREQVLIDMREGRKWGVSIALASQLLDDFDASMIDMATGVWIMGVNNDRSAEQAAQIFGLSATAKDIVSRSLNGPGPTGAPFLAVLVMKDGRHEHLLYNTLGPTELWAFSTTAEDAALRNRLYQLVGAVEARRLLSKRYPNGSAKSEIERRVQALAENGGSVDEAQDGIIETLAQELIRKS
jgi:intracellular multiplication protein IcmB